MRYSAETRIYQVDKDHPDSDIIDTAAQCLRTGGLVAFPTETVYGLGANALDAQAIERIYSAKGRPAHNPLIAHITSASQIERIAIDIPHIAYRLAAHFWPGPLTLVLKRHSHVPGIISAGRDTVATRMPAHPVALALIEAAGVPIAAPSANLFTRPSATTAQHVLADLDGHVDIILDAGATRIGLESTVLDLTGAIPTILRPGGVTLEALREVIPFVQLHQRDAAKDETAPSSPGMLLKHYSPDAELLLFMGSFDAVTARMQETILDKQTAGRQHVGVLCVDEERAVFESTDVQVVSLGSRSDLESIGHNLFAAIRTLDEQGVDVILVRGFEQVGLGITIQDRLMRAAEGHVIRVE